MLEVPFSQIGVGGLFFISSKNKYINKYVDPLQDLKTQSTITLEGRGENHSLKVTAPFWALVLAAQLPSQWLWFSL